MHRIVLTAFCGQSPKQIFVLLEVFLLGTCVGVPEEKIVGLLLVVVGDLEVCKVRVYLGVDDGLGKGEGFRVCRFVTRGLGVR